MCGKDAKMLIAPARRARSSEFVDDQELWFGKMREPLLEFAFAVTLGELGNDRSGGDELHGIPGHDRFASESYCKMGLANAGQV